LLEDKLVWGLGDKKTEFSFGENKHFPTDFNNWFSMEQSHCPGLFLAQFTRQVSYKTGGAD